MSQPAPESPLIADERQPLLSSSATAASHGSDASSETVRSIGSVPESTHNERQHIGVARGVPIFIALATLIFFQAMNISSLTTTQSTIAAELDAFDSVSWFTSAYLIAMSSLGPLTGRMSTIFTPRSCVFVSSTIFSIGSLITALSKTLPTFLIGRAVTGAGAGGVFTLSIIVVLQLASTRRRGLAVGLLNSGFTIGVAVGAIIAGALLSHGGWRALFWIQAPVTLLAGIVLFLYLPAAFGTGKKVRPERSLSSTLAQIDYAGAVTLTSGLSLVLLSLSNPRIPLLPLILGLLLLVIFILIESHFARDPIIPVSVLKSRGILLSCASTTGFMMARWLVLFYTPVYAIAIRGWNPATAGTVLIPTNAGFGIGGLLVGILHIKRAGSFYGATLLTYSIFPVTLILLGISFKPTFPVWIFVLMTFANGLTVGATLNYALAHLLHLTPIESHFIATSLLATFRGFAGSFGSAVGGGIFARILRAGLERPGIMNGDLIRRLMGSPALVQQLQGREKEVAIAAYASALKGLFFAGAGLAVAMVALQACTGWNEPVSRQAEQENLDESVEGLDGIAPPLLARADDER